MPNLLRKIVRLFVYWYYWVIDYTYVGFWQVLGFFRRTDTHTFLQNSWSPDKKQILLLPGVYERWEFMKPIARSLLDAGYSVHVVEGLGYNTSSVEEAAEVVDRYVRDNDLKNCAIVAHSKGGLIGKYVLSFSEQKERYVGMVALNTPFGGSVYAYLLPFRHLRIFTPRSSLLRLLAQEEGVNTRIYSIYGTFDPHIPGGSHLTGAHNIQLKTYGHFRVIQDRKTQTELLGALKKLF
jgi:hypothetical protein